MPAPANLVHEISASTGTGDFTLTAQNGKQRFSTAFGTGVTTNVFDYFISNQDAAEWERGTGHMSDATTLVRDTVIESTNANAAVNFSAGTKDCTNDVPAGHQVRAEAVIADNVLVRGDGGAAGVQGSGVTVDDNNVATGMKVLPATPATTADTLENFFARERWVEDFGAQGDGTTDDTAAIQAAIDRAESVGGGVIRLKAKTYSVTDLVINSSGVAFIGIASGRMFDGGSGQTGTVLKGRTGAVNVLTVGSDSGALSTITACRVENLVINGNGIASRSLLITPIENSIFRNIICCGSSSSGLGTTCFTGFAGLNYVYQCAFENIWVVASTAGKGIVLSGEPAGAGGNRTVFCTLRQIHVTHTNGTAFELNDADDNTIIGLGISRVGGGSGIGIDLIGDDADAQDLVHACMFYSCHAGPGGWRSVGSKAIHNVVFGLLTEDGVPFSVSGSAQLSYIRDDGAFLFPSFGADAGASFVEYVNFTGAASGGTPSIAPAGASTNLNLALNGKGTGSVNVPTANAVIGHTASVPGAIGGGTARFALHGIGGTQGYSVSRWTADASHPPFTFTKSRGAAVGTHTIVQVGDGLGRLIWGGSDGTQFIAGAELRAEVSGTASAAPGTNDMPTAMILATTADGGSGVTDRLKIDHTGLISTLTSSLGRGAPVTKTADFTVAAGENWIICNKAGANLSITLPSASAFTGREIMLKNLITATFTVVSAASNVVPFVGGAAGTAILSAGAGRWCTLVSDGTNWVIMNGVT